MPPPLPFPYPIHIGTDICNTTRISRILRGAHCARFIRRVLAPEELALAKHSKPIIHRVLEVASDRTAAKLVATELDASDRADIPAGRADRGWQLSQAMTTPTDEEVELGERDSRMLPSEEWYMYRRAAYFMAGRFAAKEAAFKAHPHRRLGFHDVLILSGPDARQLTDGAWGWAPGVPTALIKAPRGSGGRDQLARMSISHDGEYATATCIGFEADADALRDTDGHGRGEPRKGWLSWLSRLWR